MEYSEAFDGAKAALKIWPDGKMPGEKANGPEHAGDPANDVLRISGAANRRCISIPRIMLQSQPLA